MPGVRQPATLGSRMEKLRIAVGLSGGVDSSVAALLLKEAGHDVTGVFMKNWTKSSVSPHCSEEADRKDALRVATKLRIPFLVWDFEAEYRAKVMEVFFQEYAAGRTPNPDVLCNREIKFGLFLQRAIAEGFDKIATGHYARVSEDPTGCFHLLTGRDANKDQSYFLVTLGQAELSKSLFPVGHLEKPEVRRLAAEAGLPTAAKPDSQGICFVGPVNVQEVLRTRLHDEPGEVVTGDGQVVGRHRGLAFSTIGQRHGLSIGGSGLPYYVARKDRATNRIIVAHGNRDPLLFQSELFASSVSWTGSAPVKPFEALVRIRYRQPLQVARVEPVSAGKLHILFSSPQRAVTPGQYAAIYQGDELIGGGIIEEAGPSLAT